jgi:hypothetical protein
MLRERSENSSISMRAGAHVIYAYTAVSTATAATTYYC